MDYLYNSRPFEDTLALRYICHDILTQELSQDSLWKCDKEHSNDFTFIFVDGREHNYTQIEYLAAFKSTKLFSNKNYKILAFVPNTTNFLDNRVDLDNWRIEFIKIDPIRSHNEYSDFCLKWFPWMVPNSCSNLIFFQSDGFLISPGFENHLFDKNYGFLGSPWLHRPNIEFLDNDNLWKRFTTSIYQGNGGFSFRRLELMKQVSQLHNQHKFREYGTLDKSPPEDLMNSVISTLGNYNIPTIEEAQKFSQDPITLENYKLRTSFGGHFPVYKDEFKEKYLKNQIKI